MSIVNKGVFDADTMATRQTGNDWPLAESNVRITGTLTANAFASAGFGVPGITSATNINLSANGANGGAVVIQNSPLRLRSYTTVDRGNITASAGDTIYNSTVNAPQAFTGNTWGNVLIDGYWPGRPAFRVVGNGGAVTATNTITSANWTMDFNQGDYLNNNGYFTAPIPGLYSIHTVVRTNSNSAPGITQVIVYKNNTTALIMVEFNSNTSMNHAGGSTIAYLAAGDNIKLVVTGSTISFDSNDNFSAAYIG